MTQGPEESFLFCLLSLLEKERNIEYSNCEVNSAFSCKCLSSHLGMHWDLWVLHMNVVGGACDSLNTAAFSPLEFSLCRTGANFLK